MTNDKDLGARAKALLGGKASPELEPVISAEPITLHDIILYDARGKPAHTYKKVILAGELVRTAGRYYNTQDGWITYFADKIEKLISLPLLYAVLERLVDEKNPALAGLTKSMKCSWLCTSTRINYDSENITHNYGTAAADTFHCTIPEISYYLEDLKKKEHAKRNALQALLMPQDVDKVDDIFKQVWWGVSPYFWTPEIVERREFPERPVFINPSKYRLIINCYDGILNSGCALSVVVE